MGVRVGNSKIKNIAVEDANNILPPLEPTPWVRNPDWIDMPNIPTGESKAAFLFAVSPILQNRVGLKAQDNYFVDWGDGNSGYHGDGQQTGHQYSFDDLPASTEFIHTDGYTYRQAVFTVTPSGSHEFKIIDIQEDHPDTPSEHYGSRAYLDIHINGPDLTAINLSSSSANMGLQVEHIKIGNIDSLTSFQTLCYNMEEMRSFEVGDTSNITNWTSTFVRCLNIQEYPEFQFASGCNLTNTFYENRNLLKVPSEISGSCPTKMQSTFYQCNSLTSIPYIDTSNSTSFHRAFLGCRDISYLPDYDFSSATRVDECFSNCYTLKEIPKSFQVPNPTHNEGLDQTFFNCRSIKSIHYFDTSHVKKFQNTFSNCQMLERIPAFDFSSSTNIISTFTSCHELRSLPFINATGCTSSSNTFANCYSLESIDGLPTPNSTDFGTVFNGCYKLKEIPSGFNTVSASNSSAFDNFLTNTLKITSLPEGVCSGFGNAGVTDYGEAFETSSIYKLPESFTGINNNASNITTYDQLFMNCNQIKYIPTIDATNATNYGSTFANCWSLEVGGILSGVTQNVAYRYSKLDREAMTAIFSGLGNASKTIDIRNTPSIDTLTNADKLIATNKGWTITT